MAGDGDYAVFANERYQTTDQIRKLLDQLKLYQALEDKEWAAKGSGPTGGGGSRW